MGGDGGTFATNRKFIRGAKFSDQNDIPKKTNQLLRTRLCYYNNDVLQEPIVCCELGYLYNKETILTALLDKNITSHVAHIRGLKDIKTLKFFKNPNYSLSNEVNGELPALFSCPITKMEFNGNHPFIAIWSTGYVLSEKALKEVGIDSLQEEYGPFTVDDIIKLIPITPEAELQMEAMIARRNKKKTCNSHHKRKNNLTSSDESCNKKSSIIDEHSNNNVITNEMKINSSNTNMKSISASSALVKSANQLIEEQQNNSNVYKSLFHKDNEKDYHDRDLFMSVAGIRYTLG